MGASFLAVTDGRPVKQKSWSWGCAHVEKHKVEAIEEELQKLVRAASTGCGCSTPFIAAGSHRWRRGRTRCGSMTAGRTQTVRRRRSYRTMRSGVALAECYS